MDVEKEMHDMEKDFKDMKPTFAVYGDIGVGKTTFISYAPNLLLIDPEGGRASVAKTPNNPKILEPKDIEELGEIYLYLKANEGKFDSVAIDTLSEVEKWAVEESIQNGVKKDPTKDKDLATMLDYKKGGTKTSRIARMFRGLDMYVFFILHERSDKDESTGVVKLGPKLMPSVMSDLNGFTDFIFYIDVDRDGNRIVRTSPNKKIRAKHRIGELPDVIDLGNDFEDFRIDTVLEMINNS